MYRQLVSAKTPSSGRTVVISVLTYSAIIKIRMGSHIKINRFIIAIIGLLSKVASRVMYLKVVVFGIKL